MRITGGSLRGRRVEIPRGAAIRPTTDRVRENLFNLLGNRVQGARVLDLYAGSGLLALESLSRGALAACCVERHPATAAAIRARGEALGVAGLTVVTGSALDPGVLARCVMALGEPPGLVLMDPPYGQGLLERTLAVLADGAIPAPHALLACEGEAASPPLAPPGFLPWKARRYGVARLTIMQWSGNATTARSGEA